MPYIEINQYDDLQTVIRKCNNNFRYLSAGTDQTIENIIIANDDYNNLINKPSINSETLTGDKPLSAFGIDTEIENAILAANVEVSIKQSTTTTNINSQVEVNIGIASFDKDTQALLVFISDVLQVEGVDYVVRDNTKIAMNVPIPTYGTVVKFTAISAKTATS